MKLLVAFAALAAIVVYSLPVLEDVDTEWSKFKATYGKSFKSSIHERQRKAVFTSNYKMIKEHNELYQKGETTYFLKINKLADLTHEERSALKGFKRNSLFRIEMDTFESDPNAHIPATIDWRHHGAVTPVKDQRDCGSCWAFSTTGALEGAHFLKTGNLVELSEQNLVDCSKNNGNSGCDGGDMPGAFTYIYENDGIDSEQAYPYKAADHRCNYDVSVNVTSVRGYGLVKPGYEDDLKAAVATIGPISIAIDASQQSFDYYGGGVYSDVNCSPDDLDHAVLAVGYGSKAGMDYWLVKNSWGKGWGEEGYMKMARNNGNMCGVATECVYPLMY